VRELKLTGIRTPNYNRRADLVCFVNGLPLVFIELKAVYKNILDAVYADLPTPPFTVEEKKLVAANVYAHVWQQAVNGNFARAA
jgi:hypothetical protein